MGPHRSALSFTAWSSKSNFCTRRSLRRCRRVSRSPGPRLASADFPTWQFGRVVIGEGLALPGPDPSELVLEPILFRLNTGPADPDDPVRVEVVVVPFVQGLVAGFAVCDRLHRS